MPNLKVELISKNNYEYLRNYKVELIQVVSSVISGVKYHNS